MLDITRETRKRFKKSLVESIEILLKKKKNRKREYGRERYQNAKKQNKDWQMFYNITKNHLKGAFTFSASINYLFIQTDGKVSFYR